MPPDLRLGARRYDLAQRVLVMAGLERVTADTAAAVRAAGAAVTAGADVLTLGLPGRPGDRPVGEGEEFESIVPAVEALASRFELPIAVETSRPDVARAAADAGAVLVDDRAGVAAEEVFPVAAGLGVSVIARSGREEPPEAAFDRALAAGLAPENIVVAADLDAVAPLAAWGHTVLLSLPGAGDQPANAHTALAAAALGIVRGARLVRNADVAGTVRVVRTIERILSA